MALPFLEWFGHKGFSPSPSMPSQAPIHDPSCCPPGSPVAFSKLRTLVSFPQAQMNYMVPVTPRGTVDQDSWTLKGCHGGTGCSHDEVGLTVLRTGGIQPPPGQQDGMYCLLCFL